MTFGNSRFEMIQQGIDRNKEYMGKKVPVCLAALLLAASMAGCGTAVTEEDGQENAEAPELDTDAQESDDNEEEAGILGESAADAQIDFAMLQEKNPDIFAWLHIPGTGIDMPVLQSHVSDEYYITHDVMGEENSTGALYTEMPNLMNMCDFNTVIHGDDLSEDAPFKPLHNFEDADFFDKHEEFYLYLPDNVLTYEIFAAYYDEGSDILRRYDYTTYAGCEQHLQDIYTIRSMNRNIREEWEELTPYHFLVTLDGRVREDGRQYVVIGALVKDAAGQIDRVIYE